MGEDRLISVVITVYNGEAYVEQAITSILSQCSPSLELIIVDDGSTDGTGAILDKVIDTRVKKLSPGRIGRGRALNLAVRSSEGQYVAILDADDMALPHRLHKQATFLDQHPTIGVVGSQYRLIIDEEGKEVGSEDTRACSPGEVREALRKGRNPLFHSAVMYRRNIFDNVHGYDEALPCLLDWDFYVRAGRWTEIANLDEPLSYKRKHTEQFFGSNSFLAPQGGTVKFSSRKRARAIVLFRTVWYLDASWIKLIEALGLYARSFWWRKPT